LKNFVYFDKIKINSGGVPILLARKIVVAKKEATKARTGKNFFPQLSSFLPARVFSFGSATRSATISQDFV